MTAWGKANTETGARHHLPHHSADVAAVLIALLDLPSFRTRAERALGRSLSHEDVACIAALAFLHDIGKLAPAFQVKAWTGPPPLKPRGHVQCGWLWLEQQDAEHALAGHAPHIVGWPDIEDWFRLLFAHHGRPVPHPTNEHWGAGAFRAIDGYDWKTEDRRMGEALIAWFPEIREHAPPVLTPAFAHFFAGLLALADWIGSDSDAFPFVAEFDPDYWRRARKQAHERLKEIGLNTRDIKLRRKADWALLSDHPHPRPAQDVVSRVPASEHLVILEAETGSGKTEAALWRFARLYEAGEVDGLYFAVPTRVAARQLQRRVNDAALRIFEDPAPEAILAIPGQALAGEARGHRLPGFRTRWDDTSERPPSRWAAEHATRFLAAQIAVGTVDQAMLGGLQVKHAHLRGSALSRSLIVIDEVHASDSWMTKIQQALVQAHLALGGHAMLMSATLGSVARSSWRREPLPDCVAAERVAYPAVWTMRDSLPVPRADGANKAVSIDARQGWSGEDAARRAVAAAERGARVLVIRNTVDRARETWQACLDRAPELVFSLDDVPTLHHGRFAAEDRARLDARVEAVLGAGSSTGGVIVVGTQTLEQSLDIDADFLVTDLCPMDVLLQRIGRLHRHRRTDRPEGFTDAQVSVLCPDGGLAPLTREPENGLGAYGKSASLSGVYTDVPALAATLEEIETTPLWNIPEMNRRLVERSTHPERLEEIARANGWEEYLRRMTGKALAETQGAKLVVLDRNAEFPKSFAEDAFVATRLGEQGAVLTLPEGTVGPFGTPIRTLALPAHWSRGLTGDEETHVAPGDPLTVSVADLVFSYDASGLARTE